MFRWCATLQAAMISSLKQKHDKNLLFISAQLFEMQRKLMKKEKYLSQLISEREQVGANCGQIIRCNVLTPADHTGAAAGDQKTAEEEQLRAQQQHEQQQLHWPRH